MARCYKNQTGNLLVRRPLVAKLRSIDSLCQRCIERLDGRIVYAILVDRCGHLEANGGTTFHNVLKIHFFQYLKFEHVLNSF